jgi:gliding motility-associated protein gldE
MESGFSRLLVMQDDSLDRVMGIVHVKDLLPYIDEPDDFDWKRLVRKTFFVPERKKIDDLLTEFQANNLHMAVVVDEYGGTCGVVTLEDVMEEIFGEIEDETDDPERLYVRLNDRSYLFEGKVQINDFCKVLELRDDAFADVQGEAETLAGMMLEQLGRIPEQGESLKLKGLMFTAATVTARKIDKVRVDRVE